MPLQLRRGNTAQINAIVPLIGELIYDTQEGKIRVGNGTTAGGVVVSSYTDIRPNASLRFFFGSLTSGKNASLKELIDCVFILVFFG